MLKMLEPLRLSAHALLCRFSCALTVGALTVGALTVGALTVGALTVGALTVGALTRAQRVWAEPTAESERADLTPEIRRRGLLERRAHDKRNERLNQDLPKKELTAALEELAGLLARDLAARPTYEVSPLAIRGVEARAPLSPSLADWLEMRVEALLHQSSGHQLARCVPCRAQRTSLGGGGWVIKQGLSSPEELRGAARGSGARALLDMSVGWSPEANRVHLRARLFDGARGLEVWAQDYITDSDASPTRAAAPGVPRSQELTSEGQYEARARALSVKRFDGHFGGGAGWGLHPTEYSAQVTALELHATYSERFGEGERLRYAGRLELAANLSGALIGVKLGGELLWLTSLSAPDERGSAHRGLWLGGGGALAYVFFQQGIDLHLTAEWISGLGLGARFSVGYVFGFGGRGGYSNDIQGSSATLAAVFYL